MRNERAPPRPAPSPQRDDVGGDLEEATNTSLNCTTAASSGASDVSVDARGGRSGGALRVDDEGPDNPGYALTSDAGRGSVAMWIPAGDTILTLAAGALRDRVNNGQSVVQTITVSLDSDDPIYGRERNFVGSFAVTVLDVDESLIAVNKFLATTDPVTSGAITAKAKENAATFVFTAALTSLPFSAVRLEVEGDVDAFESISVDGADGACGTGGACADAASAACASCRRRRAARRWSRLCCARRRAPTGAKGSSSMRSHPVGSPRASASSRAIDC